MLSKAQMSAVSDRAPNDLLPAIRLRLLSAIFCMSAAAFTGPAIAQEPPKRTLEVAAGTLAVETVASGLNYPPEWWRGVCSNQTGGLHHHRIVRSRRTPSPKAATRRIPATRTAMSRNCGVNPPSATSSAVAAAGG